MTATLANLAEYDYGLRVFCNSCNRHSDLDVPALAERCGGEMPLPEIAAKARCKACGSLGGSVQVVAVRW